MTTDQFTKMVLGIHGIKRTRQPAQVILNSWTRVHEAVIVQTCEDTEKAIRELADTFVRSMREKKGAKFNQQPSAPSEFGNGHIYLPVTVDGYECRFLCTWSTAECGYVISFDTFLVE